MKKILAVVGTLASAGVIAGCGANDTGVSTRDHAPANVINFPNGFSSVAFKCDGRGHMVYETDHGPKNNGGGFVTVVNDPNCGSNP